MRWDVSVYILTGSVTLITEDRKTMMALPSVYCRRAGIRVRYANRLAIL